MWGLALIASLAAFLLCGCVAEQAVGSVVSDWWFLPALGAGTVAVLAVVAGFMINDGR